MLISDSHTTKSPHSSRIKHLSPQFISVFSNIDLVKPCFPLQIGCRSTYFSITEPITKQIDQQVKDGALDNITGEKFGWWVIWRKHYKTRASRNRREIEGSGTNDYDVDGDEDDYDYDDDDM